MWGASGYPLTNGARCISVAFDSKTQVVAVFAYKTGKNILTEEPEPSIFWFNSPLILPDIVAKATNVTLSFMLICRYESGEEAGEAKSISNIPLLYLRWASGAFTGGTDTVH
jgi:hypothetical protein